MLRSSFGALALGAALATALTDLPASAEMSLSQIRAANLARMEAERINGGLSNYFPANCMHQKGGGSCMVNAGPNGFLFDFLGGALTCSISFHAIGSSVGPDGVLHEPFDLIPIGYALAAGSVGALTLSLATQPSKR